MIKSCQLLYDYQISDGNDLLKLLDLSPLALMASFSVRSPTINLWLIDHLKIHSILKGHSKNLCDLVFSVVYKILFSSSYDLTVKFWNPLTSQCLITISIQNFRLISLQISFESQLFIYEGFHTIKNIYPSLSTLDIFKLNIKELKSSETNFSYINELIMLNAKNNRLAFCTAKKIVIFNYELEFIVKTLNDIDVIKSIKYFNPEHEKTEQELIISSDLSNLIKVWNVFQSQVIMKFQLNCSKLNYISEIIIIPKFNFKFLLIYMKKGNLLILNLKEGKIENYLDEFIKENSLIFSVMHSPKNNEIFASGSNGVFKGFKIEYL